MRLIYHVMYHKLQVTGLGLRLGQGLWLELRFLDYDYGFMVQALRSTAQQQIWKRASNVGCTEIKLIQGYFRVSLGFQGQFRVTQGQIGLWLGFGHGQVRVRTLGLELEVQASVRLAQPMARRHAYRSSSNRTDCLLHKEWQAMFMLIFTNICLFSNIKLIFLRGFIVIIIKYSNNS